MEHLEERAPPWLQWQDLGMDEGALGLCVTTTIFFKYGGWIIAFTKSSTLLLKKQEV